MDHQQFFARYEVKYLMSKSQKKELQQEMEPHMQADAYGKSTVCSLYLDTPDFRLIRRSLEGPEYKEKIRLRSYGVAGPQTRVFLELKKKYSGMVYKRRIDMSWADAEDCLITGSVSGESQVAGEIRYALSFYRSLRPRVFLSAEREAFYAREDRDFRMTFDESIQWRDCALSLDAGIYGRPVLEKDQVLLEVKTGSAIPLWLSQWLSAKGIFPTGFSKYGRAYRIICQGSGKGAACYA